MVSRCCPLSPPSLCALSRLCLPPPIAPRPCTRYWTQCGIASHSFPPGAFPSFSPRPSLVLLPPSIPPPSLLLLLLAHSCCHRSLVKEHDLVFPVHNAVMVGQEATLLRASGRLAEGLELLGRIGITPPVDGAPCGVPPGIPPSVGATLVALVNDIDRREFWIGSTKTGCTGCGVLSFMGVCAWGGGGGGRGPSSMQHLRTVEVLRVRVPPQPRARLRH